MLTSRCQWDGCDRPAYTRGLCRRDIMRVTRAGIREQFASPLAVCDNCQATYAEGSTAGKRFCSRDCQQAAQRASVAFARVARIGNRTCAFCESPVPLAVKAGARHCSVACQQAAWYWANEDRLRAAASKWKSENKRAALDSEHRRRARMYAAGHEKIDFNLVWQRDSGRCWICETPVDAGLVWPHPYSRSIDHIVPIAKGGGHVLANVALAHLRCNVSKKDRLLAHLPAWASLGREEEPDALASQPA